MLLRQLLTGFFLIIAASVASADSASFDERPSPVRTPPPAYPVNMKDAGIAGMVTLRVRIDEKGDVTECVVQKSTHSGFDDSAVTAVKKWKFKPAVKGGEPVACSLVVPVKFD